MSTSVNEATSGQRLPPSRISAPSHSLSPSHSLAPCLAPFNPLARSAGREGSPIAPYPIEEVSEKGEEAEAAG